ncbi:PDDEXK family nuclease [Leptospirillum ferrooxidans]|uniref:DUF91 domain-containing protein n=1 Tax=Leptospirillum ferrooxidans (strain C2-3) TaxID=1162668 RepID=I0ILY9_LEPFC|nr:hypothetical protein [Leptospirillum ferrooxidans]BAM06288.1 hypothetical protein LFE_0572 [Leptospirillum ferrooxidans C2-3]
MSIELGLWRIDDKLQPIHFEPMESESRLEDILAKNIGILAPELMVIGRQVRTSFDKVIDILAIDITGNLSVIELKKEKTPRNIVAQVLDYGSWISTLHDEDIANIHNNYLKRYFPEKQLQSINENFCRYFNVKTMPDELNQSHQLIIVASFLDPSTERIVDYLAEQYKVDIKTIFFRFFKDGESEYLARVWSGEPIISSNSTDSESRKWNGEYYVSFGGNDKNRDWEEAIKYGFISAGGGAWYSNTLQMLAPGARIWVNIPGTGYVGVGRVISPAVPVENFRVKDEPIISLPLNIAKSNRSDVFPDSAEYLVGVDWIKTVPLAEAVKEKGFFGNQNSVARPTDPKWNNTIERLRQRFGVTS